MKKRLPHIAPVFFLFFLLLPFAGILLLQVAQWCLKNSSAERMEGQGLTTVTLSAATVQWEKKEKELWVEGKLFDVKSYVLKDGVLTATGFFDEEESALAELLSNLPRDKKSNISLHLFLLLQCLTAGVVLYLLSGFLQGRLPFSVFISPFHPQPCRLTAERPPGAKQFFL